MQHLQLQHKKYRQLIFQLTVSSYLLFFTVLLTGSTPETPDLSLSGFMPGLCSARLIRIGCSAQSALISAALGHPAERCPVVSLRSVDQILHLKSADVIVVVYHSSDHINKLFHGVSPFAVSCFALLSFRHA